MSDKELKPGETAQNPAKRRWGRVVLILSLALNLIFVGAVVGAGWMRNKYVSNWQGGPPGFVIKRLLHHLPEQKRQKIVDQIIDNHRLLRPKYKAIRSQIHELRATLKREPFQSDAVREAAARLQMIRQEIANAKTELLVDILQQMTPQERQEILNSRIFRRLFSRSQRWPSRRY
jgi:uncharacterized membrane protein